jgi:hypothetical protein
MTPTLQPKKSSCSCKEQFKVAQNQKETKAMGSKLANKKHLPQGLILKSIIFYKMFLKL